MLPRVYYPPLKNNLYERRAASITAQLFSSKDFGIGQSHALATAHCTIHCPSHPMLLPPLHSRPCLTPIVLAPPAIVPPLPCDVRLRPATGQETDKE